MIALIFLIFEIVGEFVTEILIRGLGYLILKYPLTLGRGNIDFDGIASLLTGLLGWGLIWYLVYLAWLK